MSDDLVEALQREVAAAAVRLAGTLPATPLWRNDDLSRRLGDDAWFKLENLQRTGSFKVRGACNRLLALAPDERQRGVVAASSGNHGLGVAWAARRLGVAATVVVPTTTAAQKQQAIALLGAAVVPFGDDCVVSEARARELAAEQRRTYVSPYNDLLVAAGQGTIAVELAAQTVPAASIYVALGGGGLVSGIAAHLLRCWPEAEIVAVSPSASPALDECVRRGEIVDVACGPTLSDSTAGGVEPGAITLPLCRRLVHRFLRLDEPAIAAAMRWSLLRQHLVVEGAAALAIAGCAVDSARRPGPAVVVVCGGSVPWPVLRSVVDAAPGDCELPASPGG